MKPRSVSGVVAGAGSRPAMTPLWPLPRSRSAAWPPIWPVPPTINIFMQVSGDGGAAASGDAEPAGGAGVEFDAQLALADAPLAVLAADLVEIAQVPGQVHRQHLVMRDVLGH